MEEFTEWLKAKERPLKPATISGYISALKTFPYKLEIADKYKQSVFNFFAVAEAKDALEHYTAAPNYERENKAGHGSFNTAIKYYSNFLEERANRHLDELHNEDEALNTFQLWLGRQVNHYNSSIVMTYAMALAELPARLISNRQIPQSFYDVSDYAEFQKIEQIARSSVNYDEINKHTKGVLQGSFNAAMAQYSEFLAYKSDLNLLAAQHDLLAATDKPIQTEVETDIERRVITRRGQSQFRKRLLEQHSSCELCGLHYPQLLIASHIKPWNIANNYERLDPDNGLTLCVMHDALFDKGFISFDYDQGGIIVISMEIRKQDYSKLNISNQLSLNLKGMRANYMDYHFNRCFHAR
jgi:predicted restriction endonuclease